MALVRAACTGCKWYKMSKYQEWVALFLLSVYTKYDAPTIIETVGKKYVNSAP